MSYSFEWHIESVPIQVPKTVREILRSLDNYVSLNFEERNDLKLIFNELLFNAILHGNRSDSGKKVRITLAVGDSCIRATIMDEGDGFNTDVAIEQSNYTDGFKETGRGMKLVLALADEVVYSHNGRQVTFAKRVGPLNPASHVGQHSAGDVRTRKSHG
jgi:serine/threonine-protein kinase RsbW